MKHFIWQGSEGVRSRLIGRFCDLRHQARCLEWRGSVRSIRLSSLASIETWLTPLEMSLQRDGNFPPWLLSTLLVASHRLPGPKAAAWIETIVNELRPEITLTALSAIQQLLETFLVQQPDRPEAVRKFLPGLLLEHPRSAQACELVLKMFVAELHLLDTLRELTPQQLSVRQLERVQEVCVH